MITIEDLLRPDRRWREYASVPEMDPLTESPTRTSEPNPRPGTRDPRPETRDPMVGVLGVEKRTNPNTLQIQSAEPWT